MQAEAIRKYIKNKNITVKIFAEIIRMNQMTVYNWLNGKRLIRPRNAFKIEYRTKGEIRYEDLTTEPKNKKWMRLKGVQLNFDDIK